MNTTMLNLILWIPFLVVVFINALIFMIGGYKKGMRRALVSLSATVVGALLSLLLAKLLSPIISPGVLNGIPVETIVGDAVPANIASMFLDSIVQVMVTQGLFFFFLIFLTTVCRILMGYFLGKKKENQEFAELDEEIPEKPSRKWVGLGIGCANAMIYSLLLVLPLYGTIGAYIPGVAKMYSLSASASDELSSQDGVGAGDEVGVNDGTNTGNNENEGNSAGATQQTGQAQSEDTLLTILECITNHPVVAISGSGPVAAVYDALSETQVNDATVNYSKMADTMEAVMNQVEVLRNADEEDIPEQLTELLTILREDVVEEEWAYELVVAVKDSMKDSLEDSVSEMDDSEYEDTIEVLERVCSSRENFEKVGTTLLDNMIRIMESEGTDTEAEEDLMKMLEEILDTEEIY